MNKKKNEWNKNNKHMHNETKQLPGKKNKNNLIIEIIKDPIIKKIRLEIREHIT